MTETTYDRLRAHVDAIIENYTRMLDAAGRASEEAYDELYEYPLEIVDERGRDYEVVLTVGGPDIRIVAKGQGRAYIVARWGSEELIREHDILDHALDFYIER